MSDDKHALGDIIKSMVSEGAGHAQEGQDMSDGRRPSPPTEGGNASRRRDAMLSNFALSGGAEVAHAMSELFEERNRLRAAVKAHHFDVAHTASKGIGVRASDHALYREAGLPDVGEADRETGAEFIARMEQIEAERDRLRAVVERFQEANAATLAACTSDQSTAALEEYRAAVDALLDLDRSGGYGRGGRDVSDDAYTSPVDGHLHYGIRARQECAVCTLELTAQSALTVLRDFTERVATAAGVSLTWDEDDQVGEPGTPKYNDRLISDVEAAMAGRDRLRAVVDALRKHRLADARLMAMEEGDEDEQRAADSKAAGYWQEVVEALAALDGTGITGGESVGARIKREGEQARSAILDRMATTRTTDDIRAQLDDAGQVWRDETSAGGAGSASPDPPPTTGASGVVPPGAPSSDLQRVLVRVFTALYPPTSEGPGGVIDYTDLPEHVRAVVRERDRLKAEVSKWALRAHKAGVPVALDHATGQWTVGGGTDG